MKEKFKNVCRQIDKHTVFIALMTTMIFCYYMNPLIHVDLTDWNRTFSSAIMAGISIERRINNFYVLFLFWMPCVFCVFTLIYHWIFEQRNAYKESFLKLSILLEFSIAASYISRYNMGAMEVNDNLLIRTMLSFYIVLLIIALLDRQQSFSFSDITAFCAAYMVGVISSKILFRVGIMSSILIVSLLLLLYVLFVLYMPVGKKLFHDCKNFSFLLMWTPAIIRLSLEEIYFFTERGRTIGRYYTHIVRAFLLFILLAMVVIFLFRKKKIDFTTLGYIGAIISLGLMSFFSYEYQYAWSYGSSMANVYEAGNLTVAADTLINGKLPIIDYFSAHALSDVWTRILYCFIHSDIKGIFVNPYGGLEIILAYICLFYIVKMLFDRDVALLFVCLFPVAVPAIKLTSLSCISIVMLLYIINNSKMRSYLLFWFAVLISAFIVYDEGISLGIACILAYIIMQALQQEWKNLKLFIMGGVIIGTAAVAFYVIYSCATGLDFAQRLREWLSVSVGSSSSWATENFGEPSSLAFLLSYFIVPMCAVFILAATLIKFLKYKKNLLLATVILAFALTEVLYITRTIVYHNLAVCAGITGVLLNYIHWSLSLYVLYSVSLKGTNECRKLFAWIGTMGLVIIAEGGLVTGGLLNTTSVLYANAANKSESWELRNDMTENWGQDRIVFDESTIELVEQFKKVFDVLLTDEQTFIDFANITSMYVLTGRERPCYVGQSPSLLTDLYSQECFLEEIEEYDCPLVVVGTTETAYLQQMIGIPHNIRYYKLAEYIYTDYRPLVQFGEFAIWCKKEAYNDFCKELNRPEFLDNGYSLVDYGYDATISYEDEDGSIEYVFQPYHKYSLRELPYIWANYDDYKAIESQEILTLAPVEKNQFVFDGSKAVVTEKGNYLAFECTNNSENPIESVVIFQDSFNEGIRFQYSFTVLPGTEQYLIRVSGDYFWDIYNIDFISFESDEEIMINNVRILEGD